MAFVWYSKRSGQRARGGGCFGCVPIPFGCVTGATLVIALVIFLAA